MSVMSEGPQAAAVHRHLRVHSSSHLIQLSVLLGAVLLVRLLNLHYNIAFVDEAIYIINGQKVLAGTSGFVDLNYMFGSYLQPVIAAAAGYLFGNELFGARVASAIISTLGVVGVYLLTRRLFGPLAGLFAAAVYGFTASSIFVGQLATYDVLSISLWALTLGVFAYGITAQDQDVQGRYLFYAGILLALAFLSKYLVLMFAPVLALLCIVFLVNRQYKQIGAIFRYLLLPAGLVVLGYTIVFLDELIELTQGVSTYTSQPAARAVIIQEMVDALWLPGLLSIAGAVMLLATRRWLGVLLVLLALGGAAIPLLYHLYSANIRSMDKHLVYGLVLLAPIAGWGLAALVTWVSRHLEGAQQVIVQSLTLLICCVLLLWGASPQVHYLQHKWPDVTETIDYLAQLPVDEATLILAEAGPLYNLYLDWNQEATVYDTWSGHFRYEDAEGEAAMVAAVAAREVDYLIVDSFYTPDVSYRLEQTAHEAGYTLLHQQQTTVGANDIIILVYGAPTEEGFNATVR